MFFLLLLIFSISKLKVYPFIALVLIVLALAIALGMGVEKNVQVLLGFSRTLRGITIIIVLGAFIGEVLQEKGAAFPIVNRIIICLDKKSCLGNGVYRIRSFYYCFC
ncbi:hypothetical protein [Psychroserpens sp.]|uniref:GntT/GntP/DsdX family permease n=1 Tax=Psychroserpens sp. TaxID=2020870 RepID=UPI00385AC376